MIHILSVIMITDNGRLCVLRALDMSCCGIKLTGYHFRRSTASDAGARVNSSCGMHCHIDASTHTPKTLRNIVNIMASKEDLL